MLRQLAASGIAKATSMLYAQDPNLTVVEDTKVSGEVRSKKNFHRRMFLFVNPYSAVGHRHVSDIRTDDL